MCMGIKQRWGRLSAVAVCAGGMVESLSAGGHSVFPGTKHLRMLTGSSSLLSPPEMTLSSPSGPLPHRGSISKWDELKTF